MCVFANLDIWNKFWAGVHSVSAGWPQQIVIPLLACYTLNKRILKCPGNGILAGFHGRSAFCLEIMVCNPREPRFIGTGRKISASGLPLAQNYNINSSLDLHSASMSPSFGLASFQNYVIQFHKINQWISYTLYMLLTSCWGLTRISLMSIFLDFIIQLFQPLHITQLQSHFHILKYLL